MSTSNTTITTGMSSRDGTPPEKQQQDISTSTSTSITTNTHTHTTTTTIVSQRRLMINVCKKKRRDTPTSTRTGSSSSQQIIQPKTPPGESESESESASIPPPVFDASGNLIGPSWTHPSEQHSIYYNYDDHDNHLHRRPPRSNHQSSQSTVRALCHIAFKSVLQVPQKNASKNNHSNSSHSSRNNSNYPPTSNRNNKKLGSAAADCKIRQYFRRRKPPKMSRSRRLSMMIPKRVVPVVVESGGSGSGNSGSGSGSGELSALRTASTASLSSTEPSSKSLTSHYGSVQSLPVVQEEDDSSRS